MRKKLLAGILGGFLFFVMCSRLCSISLPNSSPMMSTPLSAYETVLDYGNYAVLYTEAEGKDILSWNFSSSNSSIGITAMVMDSEAYWNFTNGDSYTYYPLSSGDYISDYGSFYIPYSYTWYLIFWNNDPDMQSTTLTYEAAITYNYFGGEWIMYDNYTGSYFDVPLILGDIVDWEFEGSNTYIGITVLAMDEENFYNFTSLNPYTYYTLSDGTYYADFGTFTIPYEDYWYFIFWNHDSDQQSTDILWEVTLATATKPIQIISPSSSDIWPVESLQYIYYDVNTTIVDFVDIFLYQDGSYLSTIATDQAATGAFNWYVPRDSYEDSNYQIYIQDNENLLINDLSDTFIIENQRTLPYYGYQYVDLSDVNASDIIRWYFSCSNPDVDIRVYAMDSPNFSNFTLGYPTTLYYVLCSNEIEDGGLFRIPYEEDWYFVFANYDTDQEPTNIYWNITLEEFPDDIYEENDRRDEAVAISEGTFIDLAALDEDWYFMDLNADEDITIDLYFMHDEGDINLYLRDKYGNLLAYSETTANHEYIEFIVAMTDRYYIVVSTSIFSPNPVYDMIIDVSSPSTTTTTTTTTTSTTDTGTSGTNTTTGENPFDFIIPGYPLLYVLGAVLVGFVAIIYQRKIHK